MMHKIQLREVHYVRYWYNHGARPSSDPVENCDAREYLNGGAHRHVTKFQFYTKLEGTVEYRVRPSKPKLVVTMKSETTVRESKIYVIDGRRLTLEEFFQQDRLLYGQTPPKDARSAILLKNGEVEVLPDAELISRQAPDAAEIASPGAAKDTKEVPLTEDWKGRDLTQILITTPDFDFSVRTYNALSMAAIRTVDDLVKHTSQELLNIRNFGPKCLKEVEDKLATYGLSLSS